MHHMSRNESIDDFNVILEVDNVTTIKDLVQKDFGVSILAKSVCIKEMRKKKLTIVPIENLSMARATNIVYHKNFAHTEVLQDITQLYHDTKKHYAADKLLCFADGVHYLFYAMTVRASFSEGTMPI